jgi:hypothetical protein
MRQARELARRYARNPAPADRRLERRKNVPRSAASVEARALREEPVVRARRRRPTRRARTCRRDGERRHDRPRRCGLVERAELLDGRVRARPSRTGCRCRRARGCARPGRSRARPRRSRRSADRVVRTARRADPCSTAARSVTDLVIEWDAFQRGATCSVHPRSERGPQPAVSVFPPHRRPCRGARRRGEPARGRRRPRRSPTSPCAERSRRRRRRAVSAL